MRVSWTARRSNQSILKEINHEYSLKGLMLKLKLQYFGHLKQTANLLEKSLMLGKIEGVMIYIRFTAGLVQRRPLRCDGYCS